MRKEMIKIATVAELLVRIGGDSSGLRREINNSQRQLRRAFGPEALELSEGAAGLLGALAVAMGAVGIASIKMSADMQANKTAFTHLLGSVDAAKSMLDDLATFAADTPFEMTGLINASKKLLAYKFAAQDIIPIMASVGDAVALMGGGQESIDGVVRALGQIQMKGKLSAEEVNQLAERNINAWKYVAAELGVSIPDAMKLTEQGAVNATTAINGIVKGMQTEFKGGMDALSKEIPGLLSTMKDNVSAVMREIGDQITAAFDLKTKLQGAVSYLNTFAGVVQGSGIKNAILGLIPPEAIAAVFALGGALVAVAIPALYTFAGAMWLAIAPMLPYIALGAAIGVLAYEIWKNWEPLSELFGGLWNLILNKTSSFLNSLQTGFYTAVNYVMGMLTPLANLFGGSFQATISNWSNNAVNKLQLLGAESDDLKTKMQSNLGVMGNAANKFNVGLKSIDLGGIFGGGQSKPNTVFTGLHGSGVGGGIPASGGSGADKAKKEWEQLEKKADQVSEAIERDWMQLTLTQMEQLDKWRNDEIKTLDESAAANENYQRDLIRVQEVYAARKKKIIYDQQKDTNSIWDKALSDAETLQEKIGSIGLFGVDKSKFDIESDAIKQITAIQTKYRDLSLEYSNGTAEQKLQMAEAWKASGKEFEIMADGNVNFAKQSANERYIVEKELAEKIKQLHYDTQKFKDNLDNASENGNLSAYISELNSERAALSQDLAGKQEMMSAYYANWKETHRTSMSYMAEGMTSFQSGLTGIFEDIGDGIKSAGDLMKSFGSMVINILIKMQAQAAAASITSSLFGGLFSGSATSKAPTVTTSDMINGKTKWFATGGAVFGAGTGTSDSIMAMLSNGEYVINAASVSKFGTGFFDALNAGRMPAFATGGIVTGASLSSISSGYNNAGVALSSGNNTPNMRVNINNYGNANVQAEKPVFDEQSKSWVLNVMVDGLKNNSSVRSAAKGAVK